MLLLDSFYYIFSEYSPGEYAHTYNYTEKFEIYSGGDLVQQDLGTRGMFSFFTTYRLAQSLQPIQLSLYLNPLEYTGRIYLNGTLLTQWEISGKIMTVW